MPHLTLDGDVLLLHLGSDENRFHPDWIAQVSDALDQAEAVEGPRALVTVAQGKFWSNGLDLEWVGAHPGEMTFYLAAAQSLLARMLVFPAPTVAAIQGHCFAAGAMLALAHDFRVMRADRGFFCLPEVDLGMSFTTGMSALVQARLTPAAAHTAMITGRRYGGTEALAAGLVDQVADEGQVTAAAMDLAAPLAAKDGATIGLIKTGMYGPVVHALHEGTPSG
jgi:enoyl-CoA hydratase/carnithine racemase